jgi:hypothetical protein
MQGATLTRNVFNLDDAGMLELMFFAVRRSMNAKMSGGC